ncbi:MAG: DUF3810 domain-containing protein [Cytophagales bacterium]|nr:DUF3810 domain-containing protein [Cytophagales bacterium]
MNWAIENPQWVEDHYSNGFYPVIQSILSAISSIVPIPIGQLIFYSLFFGLIFWVVKRVIHLIKKKISFGKFAWVMIKNGLFAFSLFNFLFTLTWGLNYHRLKIPEIADLDVKDITREELISLNDTLISRCNRLRSEIITEDDLPITKDEILAKATIGFERAHGHYDFIGYDVFSVKSVLVPEIMSSFTIGGIYFMFTGEANVNMDPPNFLVPAVTCHEMAHQSGFASEDEANFVGYLACQFNPDINFQYSGNLMMLRYSMRSLFRLDSVAYDELAAKLTVDVKEDLRKNREYWQSFYNPIDPLTDAMYDLFLKANDQKEGIKSYSLVTSLMVGELRRSGLVLVE